MPKLASSHETAEMCRLYTDEGANFEEIGRRFGLKRQAVEQRLKPLLTPEQRRLARKHRRQLLIEKRAVALAPLRPRAEELARAGWTCAEIERELNVNERACRELLAGLSPAEKKRRYGTNRTNPRKYSREEKLAAVREAAILNNGRIGVTTYRKLRATHPHWPSADLLHTDGWNELLEAAGIPASPLPKGFGQTRYSEADCRKAAERIARVAGAAYSMRMYDSLRHPSEPSSGTLRLHYGGEKRRWVQALECLIPHLLQSSNSTP